MREAHLTEATLGRLLDKGGDEEQTKLLLHHLTVCPACRKVGGYLVELYERGLLGLQFSVVDVDLARSRMSAPALLGELAPLSFEERQRLVLAEERFRSWGLCEHICSESERTAAVDAQRAVELARLAVVISSRIVEWQPAEKHWLAELRAFAWAHLGNALRASGGLLEAEAAFLESDRWWHEGEPDVGDILDYEAQILDMRASLRRAERRFAEALDFSSRALAAAADERTLAVVLINRAVILGERGEPLAAIEALAKAELLVDRERDPRLFLCVRHNRLDLLSKVGAYDEAERLLPEVLALSETGSEVDCLRLSWIEARVAEGCRRRDEAERLLGHVARRFASLGLTYDAALAALELTVFLSETGRHEEVQSLAAEILPAFEVRQVDREALAARALLVQAAAMETVTAELSGRIADLLAAAGRPLIGRAER